MSRWKASGLHFLISVFIAVAAIATVVLIMYPPPYTNSAGAGKLLITLIGVDVTLGPLITLIIFKPGKWGLKFDLYVIATLQIAALCYGLYMISQARPVFLAYSNDRFVLVQANEIKDEAIDKAVSPFDRRGWTGPMLVGTQMPTDPDEKFDLLNSALGGGADIGALPQYYVGYESQKDKVLAGAKPLPQLKNWSEAAKQLVVRWVAREQVNEDDFFYYPLLGRGGYQALVLDKNAQPVTVLPIDPW